MVSVPTGPIMVRVTVLVESLLYMWEKATAVVLVVVPSPKFQNRLVIVPVEVSLKLTVRGLRPDVGVAVNPATGKSAPIPKTGLVAFPSLPVVNIMALLKFAATTGAKRITRLVVPNPGRL